MSRALKALQAEISSCRQCARLVAWREEVARVKRKAYRAETYWGRPVPGFGDAKAKLVIVGLAPGAHGANRTGRVFTGDASGDFLYAGLFRAGLASQPSSHSRDDGLTLHNAYITCPVRCVPPDNLPTPSEITTCRPFFSKELGLLKPRVVLALGHLAWRACLLECGYVTTAGFTHGAVLKHPERDLWLVGCYHVSQQNTQTGRLTARMFDQVLKTVVTLLDDGAPKRR